MEETINTNNPINQLPNSNQPQQIPTKNSNFLVTLLSLLLLLAVGATGFFAYQTQSLVKQINEMKIQPNPTPVASVELSPTADPTSDWETYTGAIFAFKYPKGMSLKRQDFEDPENPDNIGDLVELSDDIYKLQVSSDFMGGWDGSVCLITKDQKVDGHNSQILYFRSSEPGTETCLDEYVNLVALIENKTFTHPYPVLLELRSQKENGPVGLELFNQLLSTFKFIEPTTP